MKLIGSPGLVQEPNPVPWGGSDSTPVLNIMQCRSGSHLEATNPDWHSRSVAIAKPHLVSLSSTRADRTASGCRSLAAIISVEMKPRRLEVDITAAITTR